jgi:hypothetical protein
MVEEEVVRRVPVTQTRTVYEERVEYVPDNCPTSPNDATFKREPTPAATDERYTPEQPTSKPTLGPGEGEPKSEQPSIYRKSTSNVQVEVARPVTSVAPYDKLVPTISPRKLSYLRAAIAK